MSSFIVGVVVVSAFSFEKDCVEKKSCEAEDELGPDARGDSNVVGTSAVGKSTAVGCSEFNDGVSLSDDSSVVVVVVVVVVGLNVVVGRGVFAVGLIVG